MIAQAIAQWQAARAYMALPPSRRCITFYSEGAGYWPHLRPLLQHLLRDRGLEIAYLCAGHDDPAFQLPDAGLHRFVIGEHSVRTYLFRTMEPTVLVMTMPDLETRYPKRSVHPVHYVYVHHSIVSTHMIYRPGAFDHFDTMLCVGPHHVAEMRAREAQTRLAPKSMVAFGYPRLDEICAVPAPPALPGHVLVAPSWGPRGMIEMGAEPLIASLLAAGLHVTLRPHPQTVRLAKAQWDALVERFAARPDFVTEVNMDSKRALMAAEVMVSDWSGAALEFAFGLQRPVLFVDGPRKINNPKYESIPLEPLEASIRPRIGTILAQDGVACAGEAVRALMRDAGHWAALIRAERERWIYNPGRSVTVGGEVLLALAAKLPVAP